MISRNSELQANLIKLFSLPFKFEQKEGKRCLAVISQAELKAYETLAHLCVAQAEKLLVAYRKAMLRSRGLSWNCTVANFDELPTLLTDLINTPLKEGEVIRHQVILIARVFFAAHYSNLDIQLTATADGNKLSIAIFDAVNDGFTYQMAVIPTLTGLKQNYPFIQQVFFTDGAVQHDLISCPIYAFHLAKQLAKEEHLHDHLLSVADTNGKVLWTQMPLPLLKQAQSKTLLQALNDRGVCNKKNENLLNYFARHCGYFSDSLNKERNFATIDLYLRYAERIMPILTALSGDQLEEVIAGRSEIPAELLQQQVKYLTP